MPVADTTELWLVSFLFADPEQGHACAPDEATIRAAIAQFADPEVVLVEPDIADLGLWLVTLPAADVAELGLLGFLERRLGDLVLFAEMP